MVIPLGITLPEILMMRFAHFTMCPSFTPAKGNSCSGWLTSIGSLLVSTVEAGGDGARVDGIEFTHRDSASLQATARDAAFANARAKAEQFAGLSGQSLGEVRHITEGAGPVALPRGRMVAMAADSSGGMPIDAGEGTISAIVTVTWALGPAV